MPIDVLFNPDGDLDISSGDIRYGESTAQHQRDLLIAGHGDYKEYPAVGVGTVRFLNDNLPEDYLREVSKAFQGDGMTVEGISYDEDMNIVTEAYYGDQND